RSLRGRALATAVGLALGLGSATASADSFRAWKAGTVMGTDVFFTVTGILGDGTAMLVAGIELSSGKPFIERTGAAGIASAGIILGGTGAVALAYMDGDPDNGPVSGAFTFMDGVLWSAAGVGIAGMVNRSPRIHLLGGSLGLATFSWYRAILATAGRDDS